MAYLFDPTTLLRRANSIKNIELVEFKNNFGIYIDLAEEIEMSWREDMDEGDGFGSSDFTYALKEFIDEIINRKQMNLETVFAPCLTVQYKKAKILDAESIFNLN